MLTASRPILRRGGVVPMIMVVASTMIVACGNTVLGTGHGHSTDASIKEEQFSEVDLNQDARDYLTMSIWARDVAARGRIVSISSNRWNTANGWMPNPFRDRSSLETDAVYGRSRIVDIEITEMIKSSPISANCDYLTMTFFTSIFRDKDGKPAFNFFGLGDTIGEIGNEVLVVGERYTHVYEPNLSMGDVHMFDLMKQKTEATGHNFCSIIPELYWRKSGDYIKEVNDRTIGGYADAIEGAREFVSENPQNWTLSVPFLFQGQLRH